MNLYDVLFTFPKRVRIIAILPEGVSAESLIGEVFKDKEGSEIGQVTGVEGVDTLICQVLTKHAAKIDGTSIHFSLNKKS